MTLNIQNILGDYSLIIRNCGCIVTNPSGITFHMYQDLGTRASDGTETKTSDVKELEFDPYLKPAIHYDVINNRGITFKNIEMNVKWYKSQNPEKFINYNALNGFETLRTNVVNYCGRDVFETPKIEKTDFGKFIITIPYGFFIELEFPEVAENATCSKLPEGLTFENKRIKGITYKSGEYEGSINSNGDIQEFVIVVPQLVRLK